MTTCSACGIDNAAGANFCKACGARLTPEPVPTKGAKASANAGTTRAAFIVALVILAVGRYFYVKGENSHSVPAVPVVTVSKSPSTNDLKIQQERESLARERTAFEREKKAFEAMKAKLAAASQAKPTRVKNDATPNALAIDKLVTNMLDASVKNVPIEVNEWKNQIEALPKPPRGDFGLANRLNSEAVTLYGDNHFHQALDLLQKASAADPLNLKIIDNLILAALKSGNLEVAKRSCYADIALAPDRSLSWVYFGVVLARTEMQDQAVAAFANAYLFSDDKEKTLNLLGDRARTDPDVNIRNAASKFLGELAATSTDVDVKSAASRALFQ